nr:MAG TPA: Large polyvalent protein associated domain 38 [Caudoviricetes sp.]
MGLYASKAKEKEKEINKVLGKTMVYSKKGVSSGTPSSNTPKQTLPKASETTVLPTVTKQPETKLSLMDRVKIANEKVSRVYAQNAADMQYKKTTAKTIGPAVWNGGNTTLSALPKASLSDKIDIANANASNAYAQKASDMYGVKQKKTSVLPKANVNDVAYSEPYKLDTGNNDRLSYSSNAWLNKTLETPATPTKAKQGTSVFDRIYNALASIGDSSIGSDLSLKSAFKQSATNEKDYKAMLKQYDGLITELILERDKLSPKSNEYIQYNKLIDQVYDMANSVRDRTADMTEANKFLRNASKLQEKTTEGMGTVGKNLTEAAISVGDNLVKMALTGFNPTATLVAMGVGAAGQRANELSNSGVAANDALGRGIVSGVIEGLTEKIGVDNLYSIVKSNNVKVLADILKQAAAEGTEEGLGSVLNYAADRMAGDNEKFDWNDMAQSVIQGALSGAMFGIGGVATNKAFDAIDNYNANKLKYNDILPKVSDGYLSDVSDTNINIGNKSAMEYVDNYNKRLERTNKINDSKQSQYMKQIYDVMTGKAGEMDTVVLGNTPDILQKYGAKNIEMTMKPSAVRKIAYPTNYLGLKQGHNLGFYALEQLPQQLANPVAILKSYTQPNSMVIITEMIDADNRPVIVPIHLDKNGNIGISNEVASAYGRSGYSQFINQSRKDGMVLYENKNKGLASLPADGLQLSAVEATTDPIFNIYNSAQNVNIDSLSNNDILPTATDTNSNNNLGIVNQDAQQLFEDLQNAKTSAKDKARKAYQSTISGWAPFERMTKVDTRRNGRNITGLVNKLSQKNGVFDTIKKKALFDINANKVSDLSLDSVVKQVPTNQLNDFNTYWHELHNIDRLAQNKPVTEHTADESRQIVAQLEAQHPEFKTYKQNISNYLDLFMRTWLVDTGLITQENYNQMRNMYPNYIPTYRVMEKAGNGSTSYREGRRLRNRNPIGKAKGGTSEVLSFDEAMAYKMSSVVNAAIKNDISREVYSFAQAQPTEAAKNGILIKQNSANANTAIDIDSFTDELEKNIARETSRGNYEITFYDNGKPQTMKISKDVWEAYNFLDDKLAGSGYRMMAELGKKITSPMKAATTGYNPLFALTNIIRDAQTYAINNSAKNGAQAAKNYVKAIRDVIKGSDTYDQYRALGGSQNGYYGSDMYNNMYKEKRYGKKGIYKVRDTLMKPIDLIADLGEFTEKLPRYAEYLNTIENLGNTDAGRLQASLNAADVTVNFGRTAQLSALANAWVPYFNAGLQGADRTLRQIKAHPIKTTVRATASVFLPTLLVYLINKDNPHWEDVKDGVKDNYYLLPNYAGAIDIYGYPETFIRIPKSREFGALFSASFERFIRALDESESDNKSLKETLPTAFDGYSDTLVNSFAPPDILGDNILGSMRRLGTNTAWHGGKIIPSNLTDVSPEYQYDINTSGIAKEIANKTNKVPFLPDWAKSPMAIDYLMDSYLGYAGDVVQGLTSGKNKGATENETLKNSLYSGFVQPFKNRFTTDSAYSNYNLDRFYDRKGEITKAANDRDIRENLPSDYRTPEEKLESDFASAQKQISDLTKQEKEILNSNATIAEKNKKIRKLKQQKNNIAKEMLKNQDKLYKEYAANYIPEISGLTDSRQEDAKELNKKYDLSYPDFMKIYEGYSDIYNKDEKSAMKATEFDEYLNSLGYTKDKEISADIRDRFAYFTPSVAKSYYDQPSYQKVQSFMDVDTYVSIKDMLGNVSYPEGVRGAKSMAYKRAIDDFMQQHGYNPSYDERMKIYEACDVGKTYWY